MNRTAVPMTTREALAARICRRGAIRLPGYRFLIGRTRRRRAVVLADGPVTGEDLRTMDAEVRAAGLVRPFHLWARECPYGDTIAWQIHRLPPHLRPAAQETT
jgi:hypothetical protein